MMNGILRKFLFIVNPYSLEVGPKPPVQFPYAFQKEMKEELGELNAYIKEARNHVKKHRPQDLPKLNSRIKLFKNRIKKYKYDALTMDGDAFDAAVSRRKRAILDLKEEVKAMKRCHKISLKTFDRKDILDSICKGLKLKFDEDSHTLYW